jgi:hypothetical protein
MRSKAHIASTAPLVLHHTRLEKWAMKKFGINDQLRNKLFMIVIHRFSLVKATMHAPRICELCNGFFFQLPKVEQRPLHTCQLWRAGVFEA